MRTIHLKGPSDVGEHETYSMAVYDAGNYACQHCAEESGALYTVSDKRVGRAHAFSDENMAQAIARCFGIENQIQLVFIVERE